eukprot:TRINITY_DN1655_c6_g1_i1.p1 TRINITY_DN1655_c6_g1~~TRINITY_DN1655_c6_g1_i1.p1  ORF type:complete len:411 (+),score=79.30 TRINITY_DN1655_c6_g1_i1:151-1383(+)
MLDMIYSLKQVIFYLIDPANVILIGVCVCMFAYSSYRSIEFVKKKPTTDEESLEDQQTREVVEQSTVVVPRMAILLPIVGSIVLVILFYFLNLIYYLLFSLLMLSSVVSINFVLWPHCTYIFSKIPKFPMSIPTIKCIGRIGTQSFITLPISLIILIGFLFTNNWFLINIMAIAIGIFSLSILRIPSLKVATTMLIFFFTYDIFWVFISHIIFGQNVMETVAVNMNEHYKWKLPILVQIPHFFSSSVSLLGMGDIVIPGFFLCFLYRFDKRTTDTVLRGYFLNGCLGYCVGIYLAYGMVVILNNMSQPALMYLAPCTLIPTFVLGFLRRELSLLWKGNTGRVQRISVTGDNDDDDDDGVEIELDEVEFTMHRSQSENEIVEVHIDKANNNKNNNNNFNEQNDENVENKID